MFLQLATGYAGVWYGVDPFDQPGVELGKQLTYAAMGRPGYEEHRRPAEPPTSDDRALTKCLTVPPPPAYLFLPMEEAPIREDDDAWLMRPSSWWISTGAPWPWPPAGSRFGIRPSFGRAATDRLAWRAVFAERRRARGGPLAALGAGPGHRRPAGVDQRRCTWRGGGESVGGFTVPAINVRTMAYDTARAIFRAARAGKAGRHHPGDRAVGDRLHRAAAGGVRRGA